MSAYVLALLLVCASVLVGHAVCVACGSTTAIGPAVGLGVLMAVATLAVRLPGDGVTAALALVLAVGVAAWWLVRARAVRLRAIDPAVPLAGAGALALAGLQFLSAGRIGLPGVSLNNDTSVHLVWAESLRSDIMGRLYPPNPGYPLGPHSVMAALADGTGLSMETVLIALLLATPALMAMVAAAALRPTPLLLRAPAAAFAALTYLGAAWFAQGAFKEPLLSLLLLAFALGVGALLAPGARLGRASAVPLGVLVAASLLTYGHLVTAWLGAIVVGAVVLVLMARPAEIDVRAVVRAAAVPVALGLGAALLAVAVSVPRLVRFLDQIGGGTAKTGDGGGAGALGNLAGPLPGSELLGVWPIGDFRFVPAPGTWMFSDFKTLMLAAVVAGVAILLVRRRDVGLVAALVAGVVVWFVSDQGKAPYVTAKAMAVLSPFVALVWLRAFLPERWPARTLGSAAPFAARVGLVAILAGAGLWSTEKVLRGSPVESAAQRDQLEQLRPRVAAGPTLFLGADDYASYRFRDMLAGFFSVGVQPPMNISSGRPEKPYSFGNAPDWDNLAPETLDRFRYVVTVRSPYASAAPANFRSVARTALFEAWERTGPTAPRSVIEPGDAPSAPLDCRRDRKARRLVSRGGVAGVPPASRRVLEAIPPLNVGGSYAADIELPAGDWQLAIKYTSLIPVRVQFGSVRITQLPANTTRPGPWWPAGTLHSDGHAQKLVFVAERESRLSGAAFPTQVLGVAAVRPGRERTVPLRQACGHAVDWYRTGG